MGKLLPLCLLASLPLYCPAQDSTTANYINNIVSRIQDHLSEAIQVKKDTVIFDDDDSTRRHPLKLQTTYYYNARTFQVEKVLEYSRYQQWSTQLDIYFYNEKPARLTSTKWNADKVVLDFDIYYQQDASVHCTKRDVSSGKPDSGFFLKWCYELLKQAKELPERPQDPPPPPAKKKTGTKARLDKEVK